MGELIVFIVVFYVIGKILKAIDQVRSFAAGENGVIILQDAEGNAVLTLVKNTEGKLSE